MNETTSPAGPLDDLSDPTPRTLTPPKRTAPRCKASPAPLASSDGTSSGTLPENPSKSSPPSTSTVAVPEATPPSLQPLSSRPGDQGWTVWQDTGVAVHKSNFRFVTVQALDEICALIGVARSFTNAHWAAPLNQIQHDLVSLQRCWASEQDSLPWTGFGDALRVLVAGEERLGKEFQRQFNRTDYFPVPSGHPSATFLFLAKSVCWRAEVFLHQMAAGEHLQETAVYLNTLARVLLLMARRANKTYGSIDLLDTVCRETMQERLINQEAISQATGIETTTLPTSSVLTRPSGPNRQDRRRRR